MNLFQPQQKTSGYNTIPDGIADDETAAVGHRSSMWMGMMIVFVAGMMAAVGGTVLLLETMNDGRTTMTTAEGLVVGTEDADPEFICLPATGKFGGVSTTTPPSYYMNGKTFAFETCYQFGDEPNYCWTDSFDKGFHYMCVPDGFYSGPWHRAVDPKKAWHSVDYNKVGPLCGSPCQNVHPCYDDNCNFDHAKN